jgi:hypothetical protein
VREIDLSPQQRDDLLWVMHGDNAFRPLAERRTQDGSETWHATPLPPGVRHIYALACG